MLAECKMRAGAASEAKSLVDQVRYRYYSAEDWATVENEPGPGFLFFRSGLELSQWGRNSFVKVAAAVLIYAVMINSLRDNGGSLAVLRKMAVYFCTAGP